MIALTGGRGSMKTGHALRGILACSMQQKKKTCFFRETKETLNESLKAELDSIIEQDFDKRGFSYTKESVSHINGSHMFFKGLKEVNTKAIENLKGIATSTDFFVVDEAQAVSKPVWDVLIPTLRKKGCVLIVIYNRIDNKLPVEDCLFLDHDIMEAPEGTYFVEVNYPEIMHLKDENKEPLLSEQFVKRAELIKQNKPSDYNTIYLNKFRDKLDNAVVKYFEPKENVRKIYYVDDLPLHLCCDFNVDPMCWCMAHVVDDKIYYFDEIVIENTNTRETMKEFLTRYGKHKDKIIINGDASGDSRKTSADFSDYMIIMKALSDAGLEFEVEIKGFNPPVKNRIAAFNNKLYTYDGKRNILIDPKCKQLIYDCKYLAYKPGTSIIDTPTHRQLKEDKDSKFLGHMFDAASYPVDFYFPVQDDT